MAKAKSKSTLIRAGVGPGSGQDQPSVDDAFRHLTDVLGWQADYAVFKLNEALLSGQLRMTADGGVVPAWFWRADLTVKGVDGRAQVRALRALERLDYQYALSMDEVRDLWPQCPISSKDWLTAEVARRRGRDHIPNTITGFSRQLAEQMTTAAKNGVVRHALSARRIENLLRELGLFY